MKRVLSWARWILGALVAVTVAVPVAGYAVLSSMDPAALRAVVVAEARKATGRELTLAGPITFELSPIPAIAIENVTFGNASWGTWPEMVSVRRIKVEVRPWPLLSGRLEVRRLILDAPTILLETSPDGHGNWVLAEAPDTGAAGDVAAIPSFHRVRMRDARLLFRDGATGREITLEIARLDAAADSPQSPIRFSLTGTVDRIPIVAKGTLASRDQILAGGVLPFDLRVHASGATVTAKGEIAKPAQGRGLAVDLDVRGESVADLSPLAGRALPSLGPYALSVQVSEDEADRYRLRNLALRLGDSDLGGTATVDLGGDRPAVSGAFTATRLDLADFRPFVAMGDGRADPAPPTTGDSRYFIPDVALPFDLLELFDAEIEIRAARIHLREHLSLDDTALAATLKRGQLDISRFSARLAGGRVEGSLRLDAAASPPAMQLELAADEFGYGELVTALDIAEGVKGAIDIDAHLSARGASPRAMAATLDGTIAITGGPGRVRNRLLRTTGAGLINVVSGWRAGDNDLRLNCVIAHMPVSDGVITLEAALVDTAAVTVGVTGTVDLRDETLSLRLTPQAKHASLMSLAVPVRISGPLADPGVGPDALGTALGAAKIAGLVINPLVAGAAILLQSELANRNPCAAALERAPARTQEAEMPAFETSPPSVIDEAAKGLIEGFDDPRGE
ncbi:MAG: AsmA family protein [Alphaproteobacteria bacterium]|nr:MAG: AsmA family protein [Alphaproteobacteria bacterium]